MKVAVVGSGIAGLMCARGLHRLHDLTVYEADERLGGHANTVTVEVDGAEQVVDTGFIVYNDANYPVFSRLLRDLGVETQPSEMSFSVSDERDGYEWSGSSLSGVFAHRRNILRASHWRMLAEILRFNRMARRLLASSDDGAGPTLGEFLAQHRFRGRVLENYVIPLGASIWSADPSAFAAYPARSLFRFLDNHGLVSLGHRPRWRTVTGGSRSYVAALTAPFAQAIVPGTPVVGIETDEGPGVVVRARGRADERFDQVVLACHSDQALAMLASPTDAERAVLGAIRYQPNTATLHTDPRMLPRSPRAWASWNYHVLSSRSDVPTLTYLMNRLQGLRSTRPICVTLNRHEEIDPTQVLGRYEYAHPVYDQAAIEAQARRSEIQGRRGIWFAGAYWGYGFHEDGAASAVEVVEALGGAL